jgi:hypothetical protein
MKRLVKFNSIEKYDDVVWDLSHMVRFTGELDSKNNPIYDTTIKLPTLTFVCSEKIHGTNAGVSYSNSHGFWVQSKERILEVNNDNQSCAKIATENQDVWMDLINSLAKEYNIDLDTKIITIYYEWAGGSITGKSALSGLPKSSIIFQHFKVSALEPTYDVNMRETDFIWLETKVKSNNFNNKWIDSIEHNIYNIMNSKYWEITVDFNKAEENFEQFQTLVNEVIEPISPLGKLLGKENNVGEGIVGVLEFNGVLFRMKVKGSKHIKGKAKPLPPVDKELENKKITFVNDYCCTISRLDQAFNEVFDINSIEFTSKKMNAKKKTGDFIRWILDDVKKEEQRTLKKFNLTFDDVHKYITKSAQIWFFATLDAS